MHVLDSFFAGRFGLAEQLLLSVQVIERANREFRHPNLIQSEKIEESVKWDFVDYGVNISADFYTIPQLLVNRPTMAKRVRSYTPTRAIDVGVDRDLVAGFAGIPVQSDLMTEKAIDTLEERTAYLLQSMLVHAKFVLEWNLFAAIQENLWLKIYRDEGLLSYSQDTTHPGANFFFTGVGGFAGTGLYSAFVERPGYIRNVTRASYPAAITQWLLDSGTTARSGGVAIDNDSYITWLAYQLSHLSARADFVAKQNIDPRYVYRFNPVDIVVSAGGSGSAGSEGSTGAPDTGSPDPANDNSPGQDLLEQLATNEQPLTDSLSPGRSTDPINTLPEC